MTHWVWISTSYNPSSQNLNYSFKAWPICVSVHVCVFSFMWTQLCTKPCPQRSVYTNHLAHDRSTPKGHNTACIHGDRSASRKMSRVQSCKLNQICTRTDVLVHPNKHMCAGALLTGGEDTENTGEDRRQRRRRWRKRMKEASGGWNRRHSSLSCRAAQSRGSSRRLHIAATWFFIDFGNWKDMSAPQDALIQEYLCCSPFVISTTSQAQPSDWIRTGAGCWDWGTKIDSIFRLALRDEHALCFHGYSQLLGF